MLRKTTTSKWNGYSVIGGNLHLAIALFVSSCCCKYNDQDFEFGDEYKSLFANYDVGDTIYFQNELKDIDAMVISNIDTVQSCGCIMQGNRKSIAYLINHLPENKWVEGKEFSQNHTVTTLDQSLITIEKSFDDKTPSYFTYINYRGSGGELKNIMNTEISDKFSSLGIDEYWKIPDSRINLTEKMRDTTYITNFYWTKEHGLTGYELLNGSFYTVKK